MLDFRFQKKRKKTSHEYFSFLPFPFLFSFSNCLFLSLALEYRIDSYIRIKYTVKEMILSGCDYNHKEIRMEEYGAYFPVELKNLCM